MVTLLLIIAGLILTLAGSTWFAGAATVGTICLVVGGILLAIQLLILIGVIALGSR